MITDYKIYSVSDGYIKFLQKSCPNVYSNKENTRTHTRKYIGIVIKINEFHYYIPMSSPKKTDYQKAGSGMAIRKSIVPIIRIVVKNSKGIKELKGTLRVSHMIPVPATELKLYDIDNEPDKAYRDLIRDEMIFIRQNKVKIGNNAKVIYKQKLNEDETVGYIKSALNYKLLEEKCRQFVAEIK